MDSNIKFKVYGKKYKDIDSFCKFYNISKIDFDFELENKYKQDIEPLKRTALALLRKKINPMRKQKVKVLGVRFNSIYECAVYFNISHEQIKKMLIYTPSVEQCVKKIIGINIDRVIKECKKKELYNKFLYKIKFTDFIY